MPENRAAEPVVGRHRHDVLVHDTAEELTAVAVPFLREGLAAGEAAVVVLAEPATEQVRAALDDDRLVVLDRDAVYHARAASALTSLRKLVQAHAAAGAPRVRLVGTPDFGATPRDWLEWERYEAVANHSLAALPLWDVCTYDAGTLPPEVVAAGLGTHPHRRTPDGRWANPDHRDPADHLRSLPVPVEPLEATEPLLALDDVADFIGLRHAVGALLGGLDGSPDLVEDLHLAIDEMSSNAVRHGGPPVQLRLWASTDRVVCRISDGGPGMDDPFAGYGPAHGADLSRGGMGLWLARQLCDHVDVIDDGAGLTVRLATALR